MTDRPKRRPDDETVAKWVRELPEAQPDADFGDRLRASFTTGGIDAGEAVEEAPPPAAPRRASRWWAWAVPVFAAAAAALVIAVVNQGADLELIGVTEGTVVTVDGRAIDTGDAAALGAAIRPGAEVVVPDGASLDLAAAGTVLYEVTGGTRMTLPDTPGRWFGRTVACRVEVGELRVKTGPRFTGSELRVRTPDGLVVVTGTLLSVQCDEGGTCVCVLEGTAHVGVDEADLEPVPPGSRKVMLRDGTVEIIPIKPMHRDGVVDFDRRLGERMH